MRCGMHWVWKIRNQEDLRSSYGTILLIANDSTDGSTGTDNDLNGFRCPVFDREAVAVNAGVCLTNVEQSQVCRKIRHYKFPYAADDVRNGELSCNTSLRLPGLNRIRRHLQSNSR